MASSVFVYFALSLCMRAIILSDEGYLLSQALDMLDGKVLYRDMDAFVSPGVWLLLAGVFSVAEPSVFASRMLAFGGYLVTGLLVFRIARRLTTRAWAWGTVGLFMIFTVWAFPSWTVVFYSPLAILFVLAAIDRLLAWRASRRPLELLLCGLAVGLAIAFKQNYGAFALLGCLAGAVAVRLERGEAARPLLRGVLGDGLRVGAGVAAVAAPILAYFAFHGALDEMYRLLVLHPFVFMGRQDIGFPALSWLWAEDPLPGVDSLTYGSYWLSQASHLFSSQQILSVSALRRLHVLLFWLPALGLAAGVWLVLRPPPARQPLDGGLAALLAVAACVFLGVFPRADYNHLLNVFQPTLLAGVVVLHRLVERLRGRRAVALRVGLAFGAVLVLCLGGVAARWYVHAYTTLKKPLTMPRGGVMVSAFDRKVIRLHVEAIQERTGPDDAVLTVPALTMLNFLAERRMPGRYYNLYEHHIAHDGGAAVVEAAEKSRVPLVVADYNNFFSDRVGLRFYAPKLASYLRTHFEPDFDVASFHYLRRRAEPIPDRERVDLLAGCELEAESAAYTSEHLRFASLYHARDPLRPNKTMNTACTLRVPDRAELVVAIDAQNPWAASNGSSFEAEVWVTTPDGSERLFSETVAVEVPRDLTTSPAAERRVDLSRFAGREVTLGLRSTLEGRTRMNPVGLEGFAVVWQDPHLEVREARALLVGIDGASLRVIEPLLAAGRLPNLAALARGGVSGSLESELPPLSPRIWATIVTGKDPDAHGITSFTTPTQGDGQRLLLGTDRKVPALWNIASDRGLTSGVVNWLNSYPPEVIRGVIVSDFALAGERESRENFFVGKDKAVGHVDEAVTHPPQWMDILEELTRAGPPFVEAENPFAAADAFPSWMKMNQEVLDRSFRNDGLVTRIALELDARVHPNLLMVYLPGIDRVSHVLWGALEPSELYPPHIRFTAPERRAAREALEAYYVYTDRLLGKLVERFGPRDFVMVVSDHGFEGRFAGMSMTGGHDSLAARDGVIFARGGHIPEGARAEGTSIRDITPTILAWLGLPVGLDMAGRVAAFLEAEPPPTVSSYDGISVERVRSQDSDIEDEIIDQLRALGYVD